MPHFAGVHVYKAADPVCRELEAAGGLLARGKLVHSYPHSWRSKAPLIFRATPQWFIRMDGPEHIREKALDAIAATRFVPDAGRNRIGSMVAARPDWCISRQRAWGVPITVFVDRRTGEPLRDPAVMERVVAAFREEGADAWYSSPPSRFLGNDRDPDDYEQVTDIVDVWFESGSTHAFVLEDRGLPWPADLYLEGSDQHRGWFHSSLLEAVGTRGRAPFEAVLTHGFVLDEQGRKMSKSLGNVVAPDEVTKQYGADILRLWVMSSDTSEDLRIGKEILKQQAELYRRLRNTLRWLLGSLDGFSASERVPFSEMPELERWVLHRVSELDAMLRAAVESYDWTGVYPAIHNFCASDLSAFYFDVRKDALYCDRPDSLRRRAARTVLDTLHRCLCTWLAPALCFTAEEAWCARFGEEGSVHLELFPAIPAEWRDAALAAKWEQIREVRRWATVNLEKMRQEGQIGASLQAAVTLHSPEHQALLPDAAAWAEVMIVSQVEFGGAAAESVAEARVAEGEKCARCWRVLPEVGTDRRHPALCLRCVDAVESGLVCRNAARMRRGRIGTGLFWLVLILAADQASKYWVLYGLDLPQKVRIEILPVLNFTMVWNEGVTFGLLNGLGEGGRYLLAGIAILVVLVLFLWLRRAESALVAAALGAIAGGAIGNIVDRLRFGAVIDFIQAHAYGWSWYVFNVADAAIVCGVAALILDGLRPKGPNPDHRLADDPAEG